MVLSTVGGGMLSLAYGMRQIGLVPGLLLLVSSCWLSYFTNDLLLTASKFIPKRHQQQQKLTYWTFSNECHPSWGKHLATFTQVLLLLQNFGSFISYEIAFGGLLDLVWKILVNPQTHYSAKKKKKGGKKKKSEHSSYFKMNPFFYIHTYIYIYIYIKGDIYVWAIIVITGGIIYPLSLLRSMSALRFTSLLGIGCSLYLATVIGIDDKTWTQWLEGLLISYPLVTFCYTAQQYMLPIYVELQHQSHRRMRKVLRRSSYLILALYVMVGAFGYLTFLDGVCGNILLNNYHEHWSVMLAAVCISVSMVLAQPITTYAWRMNLAEMLFDVKQLSLQKHVVITTLFTLFTMVLSLLLTDIETVFALLGATTFPAIGFVLPAIFFVCLVPKDKFPYRRRFAIFQAFVITLISLVSFFYQIYTLLYPLDLPCRSVHAIQTSNLF
ncbi:hypothetical protein RFI_24335 [Reticulomyxa filosa]|uniref:Amino acid transporter transmembrane domain-containing protein n=1 Tax=Reticulomyxa filosa TaxID=46433 RepID=X6MH98_RETFI|nr:hypothetical protein RFI_24335 [Reticulomyxa filosa]|eukprot:ETO13041.1 hypothetical protein RFI_24335 [Reticulomyxa filosa]